MAKRTVRAWNGWVVGGSVVGMVALLMQAVSYATQAHPDLMWEWLGQASNGADGSQVAFLSGPTPRVAIARPMVNNAIMVVDARTKAAAYTIVSPVTNFISAPAPVYSLPGPQFGYRMVSGTDLDSDGVSDLVVASMGSDNPNFWIGTPKVWLYSGAAGALLAGPIVGATNVEFLGGDLVMGQVYPNGPAHGPSQALIGARGWNNSRGRVVIWENVSGAWTTTQLTGSVPNEGFGQQVAACDLDGNDVDELLVLGRNPTNTYQSMIHVYTFNASTNAFDQVTTMIPSSGVAGFDYNLMCGNFDGDNSPEIVAAGNPSGWILGNGLVAIYNYDAATHVATLRKTIQGGFQTDFGMTSMDVKDVDGDGYDDLMVAAPAGYVSWTVAEVDLFYGPNLNAKKKYHPAFFELANSTSPAMAASAPGTGMALGDGNGDGTVDAFIGEPRYANGNHAQGRVLALKTLANLDTMHFFAPGQVGNGTLSSTGILTSAGKFTSSSTTTAATLSVRGGKRYDAKPIRINVTAEVAPNAAPNSMIAKLLMNSITGSNIFRVEIRDDGGTAFVTVQIRKGSSTAAPLATTTVPLVPGIGARFGLVYLPGPGTASIVDVNSTVLTTVTPTGTNSIVQGSSAKIAAAIEATSKALISKATIWYSEEDGINPQGLQMYGKPNGHLVWAILKKGALFNGTEDIKISYENLPPLDATWLNTWLSAVQFAETTAVSGSSPVVYREHLLESQNGPAFLPVAGARSIIHVRPDPTTAPLVWQADACTGKNTPNGLTCE